MRVRLAIALYCCASLAACGGGGSDGSDGSDDSLAPQPTPKQPIASQIVPFDRALAKKDCPQIIEMTFSLGRGKPPGAPATADECKGATFPGLRGNHFTRAKQYGTAALMEAPATKRWAVWAIDGDRQYRYTGFVGGPPLQIGTPLGSGSLALQMTKTFVKAVREQDCKAMAPLFSHGARLVVGEKTKQGACKAVLKGQFLAPALRATPKPKLTVMGGTANVAFVGLATDKGYFTFVYNDAPKYLRLIDVLPNAGSAGRQPG